MQRLELIAQMLEAGSVYWVECDTMQRVLEALG